MLCDLEFCKKSDEAFQVIDTFGKELMDEIFLTKWIRNLTHWSW